MPVGAAAGGRLAVGAMLLLLSGCAASESLTLPTRPPLPAGWLEIDMGTVQVAVPQEWGPDLGGQPGSIVVSALLPPGPNNGVGVLAAGPRGEVQPDPPITDARLAEFLLTWGAGREPEIHSTAVVLLPAGRAVVVRATHDSSTPDSTEVHVYGISTSVGVAVLQVIVDTELLDRYGTAMDLIPYLFQFRTDPSR